MPKASTRPPSAARIAFIGAGNHATGSLYPNIPQVPRFDLVAVCDVAAPRARHHARKYGAAPYTDAAHMLDEVRPDGVCICGPPSLHFEMGMMCLERSTPIFIEKPPAPDLRRAVTLAATARRHRTWGMVGFMKRFAPANLVAREFMGTRGFGALAAVNLIHGCGPYDDTYRMLAFNGIHMIDLAAFFGGPVAAVWACGTPPRHPTRAMTVGFRYRSGAAGSLTLHSGMTWQDCFEQAYVAGQNAVLVIDASRGVELIAQDRRFARGRGLDLYGWSSRYYVSGNMAGWTSGGHYTRGYCGELAHFADACLGRVQPAPTLDDGMEAMRFMEAVMTSLRHGGGEVRLDRVKPGGGKAWQVG